MCLGVKGDSTADVPLEEDHEVVRVRGAFAWVGVDVARDADRVVTVISNVERVDCHRGRVGIRIDGQPRGGGLNVVDFDGVALYVVAARGLVIERKGKGVGS